MPFLELWVDYRCNPPVRMILDADNRMKIKQGQKVIATYHEENQKWYGFVNGKLIQVEWLNLKSIVMQFGVQY